MNAPNTPVTPSASPPQHVKGTPPFKIGLSQDRDRWLKMLVYAKHGVGKTTLAATSADVPQMRDVLFVDAEAGELAIEDNPRISEAAQVHLIGNRVRVTNFKEAAMVYEFLSSHGRLRQEDNVARLREYEAWLRQVPESEIQEPARFRTIIIDSMTELEKYNMYDLLGVDADKIPTGNADEIETSTWDEFKKNNQSIQIFLRKFRDLPMNLIVVAAEAYVQDEVKRQHFAPALTGKLSAQVQGFFDIVGRMTVEINGDKRERRLYVQPVGNFAAKNRRAMLQADYFVDPTMHMIMRGTGLLK